MASGFMTKEWKARIAEFATRRFLSIVSQSPSSMTVEVNRSEGLVSQEGDAFSPENMNGLEQRVYNAFASVDRDIEEAKKSASDGKTLIAAAITAKRVAASASDTFAILAQKIGRIILGSGNAARADVLSGKTFTNDDGVQYTGTMPNRGALNWSGVNTTGGVSAGYYSGGALDSRPSYNKGVSDADGRVNINSASYNAGYSANRPVLVGSGEGDGKIDIKGKLPNYAGLSSSNFIVSVSSVRAVASAYVHDLAANKSAVYDRRPGITYNAGSGEITVTNAAGSEQADGSNEWGGEFWVRVNVTVKYDIYAVNI